jgi:hypothetical protein
MKDKNQERKIEFEIGGETYSIGEITIKQYYEIEPLLQSDNNKSQFELMSILSGCEVSKLKKLRIDQWTLLWSALNNFMSSYFSLDISKIEREFSFGGVKYGIVSLNEMSIGEFADLDVILSSPNSSKRVHEALAILYRPIVKKGLFKNKILDYDEIDFEEQSEIFKDLSLKYVKSAISFFLLSGRASYVSTVSYLIDEILKAKMDKKTQKEMLETTMLLLEVGGVRSTHSQVIIQDIYETLQNYRSEKHSTGLHGNLTK